MYMYNACIMYFVRLYPIPSRKSGILAHTTFSTRSSTHLIPTTITDPVTHIHKYIILKYCLHGINYMVWKMWKMVIYIFLSKLREIKKNIFSLKYVVKCHVYALKVLCIFLFYLKIQRLRQLRLL